MSGAEPRQRKDGRWYVRPFMGTDPVTHKAIRPYHLLAARDATAARAEAAEWIESAKAAPTVHQALDRYVQSLHLAGSPANTIRSYAHIVSSYVAPRIGSMRLREVTPAILTSLYGELMERGGKGGAPLSRRSVAQVHWFLHGAFAQIEAEGGVAANPARHAAHPIAERSDVEALGEEDVAGLGRWIADQLASEPTTKGERRDRAVALAARIALSTGLRLGEVCAIRRRDVDLARANLRVSGTVVEVPRLMRQPTTKGKRTRNLALSDADVALLRNEMARQRRECPSAATTPLVTADGRIMRPSYLSRRFSAVCGLLGLPEGTHFHTLRHTHATWLLMAGVDLRTASERLGHTRPETTLGIYAHVMPGRDRAAAEAFQALVASVDPMPTEGFADPDESGNTPS